MSAKNQLANSTKSLNTSRVTDRAKVFWGGLRPEQRWYLGAGLAVTAAAILLFVNLIAKPTYKPLMSGLEAADAQAIAAQLAAKKIPYILGPDGTSISVPGDQVDAARLEVASHDSPHSGRIGFEIFDKVSWGQTEFDEKVNYQRALEGELERTIQTIRNVKSARVHLVMATDSVFVDRERGAKASVTLRLRRGSLSREDLSAISRLVAAAVDELKPSDVVIVDADSSQSLGQTSDSGDGSEGIERELTRRLVATLSPVVGVDHVHASVNVEYETSSSEESQEKYDPAVSATLTMQHSEEASGPGAAVGGVPGTSSNVPSVKPGAPKSNTIDAGQSSKTDNNTYGVNRTTRHVIQPAGSIRRLTAAVLLDDVIEHKLEKGKLVEVRHKRQPDELKVISALAQAAIGFNAARGDVVNVENLTFDHAEVEDAGPVTLAERAKQGLSDYATIVRYSVILVLFILVYLLAIRPLQKRVLAASVPQQQLEIPSPPPLNAELQALEMEASLAHRNLALKKQVVDFVNAEPESSTVAVRAWLREETL